MNAPAIRVFSTNAVNAALTKLAPLFEAAHGSRIAIDFNATDQILARVKNGETADLVIATRAGIDELTKLGKIAPASRIDLGSTGVGIGVRAGAAKPDISSVAAFRRALLDAQSIAYASRGVGGILLMQIAARFGIAGELQAKSRTIAGGLVGELVVRGEAELCVQMISEILAVEGCELAGPLPPGLQQITVFSAAVLAGSPRAAAARALAEFLAGPAAASVMQASGFARP
ncbi:MAG: substrate-binding domain-containing protein [Burkholderiales bacterium]